MTLVVSAHGCSSPTRVALVEDDFEVRSGLQLLLGASTSCVCVGAFASGEEALQMLAGLDVTVVLVDMNLPGMSGLECIRRLKILQPAVRIMMLTVFEDHDLIFESLIAGASGYLLKQTPPARLLEAIAELDQGGSSMSTQIARRVVEAFQDGTGSRDEASVLSLGEKEIIALLAKGFLYKEIASKLGLSVETIRTHLHHVYGKLHLRTRPEAVIKM